MLAESILRKRWLRSDTVWVSRLLYRPLIRRIPLFFDTWILMRSQYWPRERIDALSAARLSDILNRVSHIPYWKRRFEDAGLRGIRTVADFGRMPLLTKKDFLDGGAALLDAQLLPKSHTDCTSGSTGEPFNFRLDWRAELRYFAVRERMFLSVAHGESLPVVYFRSRINPGFFFGRHFLFHLRGYNYIQHRLTDLIAETKRFTRGFILYGYTSSFVELARRLAEAGVTLPIKAVVATGESLREADRALVERELNTIFVLTYATWEVKWIGHECEHKNIHINEEYVYVEIVDESGTPLPLGKEGRVVVTSFDSEAMPFIRYATGDRGVLSDEPCPCGRTLRRMSVSGRQTDVVETVGRHVPLFELSTAFDTYAEAVRQYQITQTSTLAFSIKVVATHDFQRLRPSLENKLVRVLHPEARITWDIVEEIPQAPSGKAKYFMRTF